MDRQMHLTLVVTASIWFALVSSQAQSSPCGCLEEPASGSNRKEKFCRPHLTPPSELRKPRSCICRPGLVRNAWGDCITKHECLHCKCFRDKDFNVCARKCPLLCNQPIRASCSQKCVLGCDCPPGSIRDPRAKKNWCVNTTKCAPICPPHSRFEPCVSTCAPKCGKKQPSICVTRCQRGGCVCLEGYAEAERDGEMICVPLQECYLYMGVATSTNSTVHGHIAGGISTAGTATLPGLVVRRPEGTALPGVVGSGPGGISVDTERGSSRGTYGVGGVGGGQFTEGTGSPDSVESGETGSGTNPDDIPSYDTAGSGRGSVGNPLVGVPSAGPVEIGGTGVSAATVPAPSTASTVAPVTGGSGISAGATGAALSGSMTPSGTVAQSEPRTPAVRVHLSPSKAKQTTGNHPPCVKGYGAGVSGREPNCTHSHDITENPSPGATNTVAQPVDGITSISATQGGKPCAIIRPTDGSHSPGNAGSLRIGVLRCPSCQGPSEGTAASGS